MDIDTVIDREDGIMRFVDGGSMFEIDGLNELRPETTTVVGEPTTVNPSPEPTFVIMQSPRDDDTKISDVDGAEKTPKLFKSNLMSSSGVARKPFKPMTSHGLLGVNPARPGLLMAAGSPSRDPTCPPVNGSTEMVLSDGFYRKVCL